MRTVRRLLYRDILSSFTLVMAGFLALFFFLDFIDDLDRFQRLGLGLGLAVWSSVLKLPGRFYELMPIAVLIGTIFSMARLAQSSEFTILRTGGLGPQRALGLLSVMALAFAVLAFVVGDFVNPWADRQAQLLKSTASGGVTNAQGAWMKDRIGDFSYAVHVGRARSNGTMEDVPPRYKLHTLDVVCGKRQAEAQVRLVDAGTETDLSVGIGDGPLAAAFAAVDALIPFKAELDDLAIQANTPGRDAVGEVNLRIKVNGKTFTGRGASPDVVDGAVRAYLHALNKASHALTLEANAMEQANYMWGV